MADGIIRNPIVLLHVVSAILAFLLITTLHVVAGAPVPKRLAIRRAEHLLLSLARPLQVLHVSLRPLRRFFETLSTWILRGIGHDEIPNTPLRAEELKLVGDVREAPGGGRR